MRKPDDDGAGTGSDVDTLSDLDFQFETESEAEEWDAEGTPPPAGEPAGDRLEFGLVAADAGEFRHRWEAVQAGFVDDPHRAVEQADNLVDVVLKRLTESFTRERDRLVLQWDQGGEPVSTESLRITLRGYRALLDRLLSL